MTLKRTIRLAATGTALTGALALAACANDAYRAQAPQPTQQPTQQQPAHHQQPQATEPTQQQAGAQQYQAQAGAAYQSPQGGAGMQQQHEAQHRAQQQAETQLGQATGGQAFSDDQLRAYALAALEVQAINESYQPRVQAAQDQGQMDQLRTEAETEMVEAVQDQGLSVDEYNQITQAAQADGELRGTIMQHMQQAQ